MRKKVDKMKYCKNCKTTYDDTDVFCPDCGIKLEPFSEGGSAAFADEPQQEIATTSNLPQNPDTIGNTKEKLVLFVKQCDESSNAVQKWLPAILVVIGWFIIFIAPYISLFLFLLCVLLECGGLLLGLLSNNIINKTVAVTVASITFLRLIQLIWFIASLSL